VSILERDEVSVEVVPRARTLAPFFRASLRPLLIFALSRLLVLGTNDVIAAKNHRGLLGLLTNWDSGFYIWTAIIGYPQHLAAVGHQNGLGFFPFVTVLTRLTHWLTLWNFQLSGVVGTSVVAAAAAVAVWWMLRDYFDLGGADRGTLLVFVSPGAFVLSMAYSEGGIILFGALSLLALHRRQWVWAGIAAAVATTCDPVGLVAVLPCAVAALQALWQRREWRALWAPVLAPSGAGLFFFYLWRHVGTPLAYFIAQRRGWQNGALGSGISPALRALAHPSMVNLAYFAKGVGLVILPIVLWWAWRQRRQFPVSWWGFIGGCVVLGLASATVVISPRLLLRDFPLLAVVGATLPRRVFWVVAAVSALAMCALTVATSTLFYIP